MRIRGHSADLIPNFFAQPPVFLAAFLRLDTA